MNNDVYNYTFLPSLDMTEVQATVTLAILATESLYGEARVHLETRHSFDAEKRTCVIDATGEVGRNLNRLFLGFVSREFGPEAFRVQRRQDASAAATPSAA